MTELKAEPQPVAWTTEAQIETLAEHPVRNGVISGKPFLFADSPSAPLYSHATVEALRSERDALREASQWQPIETVPQSGEFLVYGSYLYPDDTDITEYMAVGRSTGKVEYPIETHDGEALLGVFSHWMPLPTPPALASTGDRT